jgi:hypothetical protein
MPDIVEQTEVESGQFNTSVINVLHHVVDLINRGQVHGILVLTWDQDRVQPELNFQVRSVVDYAHNLDVAKFLVEYAETIRQQSKLNEPCANEKPI